MPRHVRKDAIRQDIGTCRSADGVRIAHATVGEGSGLPLVKAGNWLNHLEFDWKSPIWRHLLEELAEGHRLVRYDARGNGLSDWDVERIDFEGFVRDLEAVVDALGLETFALLGISQGCAVSVAYAVRHPERVSHLVLHGGYARGWAKRGSPELVRQNEALLTLIREGWGKEHPAFRRAFTSLFVPDATEEQRQWFDELQRISTSPENAVRLRRATGDIDVTALLPEVRAETLVLHCRDEAVVPFENGEELAAAIPGARFVPLESRNHLVLEQEPAFRIFIDEVRHFLWPPALGTTPRSVQGVTEAPSFSQVDALFDAALDRPTEERSAWLEKATEGDERLRAEVERLLALSGEDDDRLEPSGEFVGELWEDMQGELDRVAGAPPDAFQIGQRAGSYQLLELLGSGGMGRVYVAQDDRLDRKVALKVLPPGMNTGDQRKRFEREAKAVAALNHPNIVHLYSVEQAHGRHFITMELVRGETLASLLPEQGFPVQRFFDIAIALADGISAAHQEGIIHRDLKPANVMVSEDGRVKILDFGIAKLKRDGLADRSQEDTDSATASGHIVGTISHMSPEQAEGKDVDHRSDIFSLGVILYEMATGHRPFTGDSTAAVLSAILRETPRPVTERRPDLPREVGRIIQRCLAKERGRRYQSALDIRNQLEDLRFELDSRKLFQASMPPRSSSRAPMVVVAMLALGLALLAGIAWWPSREPPPAPASGNFTKRTSDPGREMFPSLSPDARFLVYAAAPTGAWDIHLLRLGGRRVINLTEDGETDDTQPVFSPDGERIAFRSSRDGGGIFVMGATGEFQRRITSFGWNPTWSPDGTRIAFATEAISRTPYDRPTSSEVWTVEVETGATERLVASDAVQPSWSPGGTRIAYWSVAEPGAQRDIWTVPAEGGAPKAVTRDPAIDWNPVWSPDGRFLYFSSDRGGSLNLWRVSIDETTGEPSGEPEAVTTPATFVSHMSFSGDGKVMAYVSTDLTAQLQFVELDPRRGRPVERPDPRNLRLREVATAHPSPDGEWVAYARDGIREDLFVVRPDGSDSFQLTDDEHRDRYPRWSPDGERIAFYSNRSGSYEIWTIAPDGTGLTQLTDDPSWNYHTPVWSPDGGRMAATAAGGGSILFDPTRPWSEGSPQPLPEVDGEGNVFVPFDWSPDGSALAGYVQTPNGIRSGIALYDLQSESYETVTDFGLYPRWLADNRRLLFQGQGPSRSRAQHHYQRDYTLFIVDRVTGAFEEILAVPGASIEHPVPTRDNGRVYFALTTVEADVWTLEFDEPSR